MVNLGELGPPPMKSEEKAMDEGARLVTYRPQDLGAECSRCLLRERRPVPPTPAKDPLKPRLIIVGMNPGRLEENKGQVFIGPSGKMLTACLAEAGFDRADAHITNAAMCFADDDRLLKSAVACCAPRLAKELAGFDPTIPIMTLGAEATRSVLGRSGIQKARGFVWKAPVITDGQIRNAKRNLDRRIELKKEKARIDAARDSYALIRGRQTYSGRIVMPSVHPAFILRGADGYLPVLRLDIKRVVRWVKAGPKGFPLEDEVPFTQTDSPVLAKALLAKMGKLVNVDIETDGNDPMTIDITCVGVADVDYIAAWDQRRKAALETGRPRPKFDKTKIVILDPWNRRLAAVLAAALKSRTAVTHNGPPFDSIVLARHGITYAKSEDTLIAHYSFASDKPKSLAFVGSIYTDASPWKIKFKTGSEEKGVAGFGVKKEDLARYNAADVMEGSLAWVRMQPDLGPERRVYEHDMRHAALVRKFQINGLLVDQARMKQLSQKLKFRSAALLGEMRSLLGKKSFNPSKPNDIRWGLFKKLKAKTYYGPPTPTGLPSTAASVLEVLKQHDNKAGRLADLIVRWRSANDSRSEYLDNVKIDVDGRVHAHWRSYGTVNGRPATRNPNILNITRIEYCPGCGEAMLDGMRHYDSWALVEKSIDKWSGRGKAKTWRILETSRPEEAEAELMSGLSATHHLISSRCLANCKKTGNPRPEPQPESQLRDIYIAPDGHTWVYFDLSQVEMRFAANLSGDDTFIKSCLGDVHAANARILFAGIPGALDDLQDPKGRGKRFRDIAKDCGFAISYLAEADNLFTHLLERGFEVDMDVCQDAIDRIHTAYWRYYEWAYEQIALCRRQGYLRTAFIGRKRWMGYHPKPTEIPPFLISGGTADVMNERLWQIDQRLPRGVKQVLYQYDSAIYETPDHLVDEVKGIISSVWAEPVVIPGEGREFPQLIDLKTGKRWSTFG
jgi:uracil-DNA glycosylase family 4